MYLQVFTVVLGCLALLDQANAAEPRLNWQEPAVEGTLLKVYKIWITHPAPDQLTPGEEARDRARGLARLARVPINAEDPSVTLVEYGEFLNTFSNHFMPLNFGENVTTDIAGLTTDDLDDVESRIKAWNFVGCAADNATRRYCLDAMLMLSQLAKAPGAGLGDPRTDVSKLFKDKWY